MDEMDLAAGPCEFRAVLRDVVACPQFDEMCRRLGFVPAGADVDDMEHRASHQRLGRVEVLLAPVVKRAITAADVLYLLANTDEDGEVEHDCEEIESYRTIARAAAICVIGHLLEEGLLVVNPMVKARMR